MQLAFHKSLDTIQWSELRSLDQLYIDMQRYPAAKLRKWLEENIRTKLMNAVKEFRTKTKQCRAITESDFECRKPHS
jgi:hypothetical protein